MSIVSGDKQVKPGWYQDGSDPDIYRAYINKSTVGNAPSDLIYEFNTRTGGSNILTSGINRQNIWQVNGSTPYKPVNVNSQVIKDLKAGGLDVTALQRVDQSYANWARENLDLTGVQEQRLNSLGRFNQAQQPAPPDRNPNAPDAGSNPSNTGGGAGGGGSVTFDKNILSEYGSKKNNTYPENIRYPENINLGQDHMVISQFKYVVPDVFKSGFDSANAGNILGNISLSSRTFGTVKTDSKGSVILPMPSNISEANETGWGSNELSTLSAAALATGVGLAGKVTDLDFAGVVSNLGGALQGVRGAAASKAIVDLATLNAGAKIVSTLGLNVDAAAFRSRATGTVVNPNLELLFQGPKLRSFQFQIKMTPRSQKEAQNIRRIIKFFKKGMAAQRSNTGENSFFLGAPNVFQIRFMSNGKQLRSITQIKTCALTNFTVDYTADGLYASYEDSSANGSQPIATNITMSFSELTPIYEDNYGADDHVGFGDDPNLDSLESYDFTGTGEPPNNPAANAGSSTPPAGGASAPVAPLIPITGGRDPTAIQGDPGYRPPSPGGGFLEGTGSPFDRRGF
jgi:hypothetical protein